MVLHSEKRLLWHPRHKSKFIVGGGSTLTLYEWASHAPEIRHVTSQHDLTLMKCFTWSPDPSVDDLVAIGQSSGAVDLIRLESTKVAHNHVLSGGPRASLLTRPSRPCMSMAFCSANPNYLAVGLDKVRGEPGLVIWDVQSTRSTLAIDPFGRSSSTSCRFTIPRAENNPRNDNRILQQHAPTDFVSSVVFLSHSSHILLASISHRWFRQFDLRAPVPTVTNVASKDIHGIATDPLDPHRVGTFGDGIVSIWDTRRILHPLLAFTPKDAQADGGKYPSNSSFSTIEFSSTRKGTLATLEKDSSYVRFWDLRHARAVEVPSDHERKDSQSSTRTPRLSWASPSSMLPWSGSSGTQTSTTAASEEPRSTLPSYSIVLSDTRRTGNFRRSLSSFALVPTAEKHPLTSKVMVVNRDGDLELYALHDTPNYTSWSARGDLTIGCGTTCRLVPGYEEISPPPNPWDVPVASNGSDGANEYSRPNSTIPPVALFGRGDEDGFPALRSAASKDLSFSVKKRTKAQTASLRAFPLDRPNEPPARKDPSGEGASEHTHQPNGTGHHNSKRSRRAKSASKGRKRSAMTIIRHVVEDDISMVMRRRVIKGYGLTDPYLNHVITQDDPSGDNTLSELWAWIHHSRQFLSYSTSRMHGYDFSFQGLLGIWEGFPISQQYVTPDDVPSTPRELLLDVPPPPHVGGNMQQLHRSTSRTQRSTRRAQSLSDGLHGHFHAAIAELSASRNGEGQYHRFSIKSDKLPHRALALQLCGWSLREEDLSNEIKGWEKENKYAKAACWLVFTGRHEEAIKLLMRSEDESHQMMSGTLAALIPHSSGSSFKNPQLREHTERLITRLQDPYFRAMLTHLISRDWREVLEEDALALREKLVIAFQFLEDDVLTSFLRRAAQRAVAHGDIEGLVVTGLTPEGMNILQNYVDVTGDMQTASILSSYVSPSKFKDSRAERWVEAYQDILDGWKLFYHRCQFDIERGEIIKEAVDSGDLDPHRWIQPHILLRCNYCSKDINVMESGVIYKGRSTACPSCGRPLPRCSICLMSLSIIPDSSREAELARAQTSDTFEEAVIICQTCRHGGHASHILEWFYEEDGSRSHPTCAVADCDCRCADEF